MKHLITEHDKLVDKVCKQLKKDIDDGDLTSIVEMLSALDDGMLQAYLPIVDIPDAPKPDLWRIVYDLSFTVQSPTEDGTGIRYDTLLNALNDRVQSLTDQPDFGAFGFVESYKITD